MGPEAPVQLAQLVFGVALDRQSTEENDALAVLELVSHRRERRTEPRDREILARDVAPGEAARLDGPERLVELGELRRREPTDPARRIRHLGAEPGARPSN